MVMCCAISRTSTPSAAAALNTLAPSQCSGSPCSRALHVHMQNLRVTLNTGCGKQQSQNAAGRAV